MGSESLQVLFQGILIIGVILTAVGGLGSLHFSKTNTELKTIGHQQEVNELLKKNATLTEGNLALKEKLEPFYNLAHNMYPAIPTDAALERLASEILQIKEDTLPTGLIPSNLSEKQLPDGSFEYSFLLEPEGRNIIPMMSISVESTDSVKINSLFVQGDTLPIKVEAEDIGETGKKLMYRSVVPSVFKVTVHTEEATKLKIGITPFRNKQPQGN